MPKDLVAPKLTKITVTRQWIFFALLLHRRWAVTGSVPQNNHEEIGILDLFNINGLKFFENCGPKLGNFVLIT